MKKTTYTKAIAFMVLVATILSFAVPYFAPSVQAADVGSLKYFGYYGTPPSSTSDYTNLVFLDGRDLAGMNAARANHQKVIALFPQPSNDVTYLRAFFNPAPTQMVREWANAVMINKDIIVAIHVADEPVEALEPGDDFYTNWAHTKRDLEMASTELRKLLPGTNFNYLVNFEGGGARALPTMPSNYEWISFDCYGHFENCAGSWGGIPDIVASLNSKLSASQKIFLIPQAFRKAGGSTNVNLNEDQLIALADQYFNFAKTQPKVIGMMAFIWNNNADGSTDWTGLAGMPRLQAKFADIGAQVLGSTNTATPACTSSAPESTLVRAATVGTERIYASGVTNATSVTYAVWTAAGGQDDIVWYPGVNEGAGTWHSDINLNSHKDLGIIHVHVYMHNSSYPSGVFCGTADFTNTNDALPPACLSASSVASETIMTTAVGTRRIFANGVTNATSVTYAVWTDKNGQDDIVWYPGVNEGGGTWYSDINLNNHMDAGPINVHVYTHNAAFPVGVFCGTANFLRRNFTAQEELIISHPDAEPAADPVAAPIVDPVVTSVVEPVVDPVIVPVAEPIINPVKNTRTVVPAPTIRNTRTYNSGSNIRSGGSNASNLNPVKNSGCKTTRLAYTNC